MYGKEIRKTYTFDRTTAEQVCLTQNNGNKIYDENLWLFSRIDEYQHKYSVGFFMEENGRLRSINEPAFCFFPTKEVTGLSFIIHAPFLLTDSREGIRAGVEHNEEMVRCLADLAAHSIVLLKEIGECESTRLIDDNILNIIPYDPDKFSEVKDKRKISFYPFYKSMKEIFGTEQILPSVDDYTSSDNAYWASVPQLTQLFSNEQLSSICENSSAHWVFTSIGRDEVQRSNKALFSFIESIVRTNLSEDAIISGRQRDFYYNRGIRQSLENIRGITAHFIESQPYSWLHTFYKWISETKHRRDAILKKQVFLNENRRAVAAYDEENHLVLFLPVYNVSGYSFIDPVLLKNVDTKKFIEKIGIKTPSLRDQIYNKILPLYEKGGEIDTDPHFKLFFDYYCKCSNDEVDDFIELIKEYAGMGYEPHQGIGNRSPAAMCDTMRNLLEPKIE